MTKNLNKELNAYYRDISRSLLCSGSEKKKLLDQIKSSVENYLVENPDATIESIIEKIGSPEEISDGYYSNMDGAIVANRMRIGRKILLSVTLAVASALMVYIIAIVLVTIADINSIQGYFEEPVLETVSYTEL